MVGTVRNRDDGRAFEELSPDLAHARLLDVTDDGAVAATIADVSSRRGQTIRLRFTLVRARLYAFQIV